MAAGLADGSIARPAAGSLSELAASSAARAAGLGDAVGAEAYGRMAAHGAGSLRLDTSHTPAPPSRAPKRCTRNSLMCEKCVWVPQAKFF